MASALLGKIQADPIAVSRFKFTINGFGEVTATEVDGLEQEIFSIDTPDHASHPSGVTKYGEATVKIPAHHTAEIAEWDRWYRLSLGDVSPDAKRECILEQYRTSGNVGQAYHLLGAWCKKFEPASNDMSNESDAAFEMFTVCYDTIERL